METGQATLQWILITACVGSGMMAGLFSSFSVFMMKALASVHDANGIRSMQAINRFIVRPSFLLVFLGTGLLCALSVVLVWGMPVAIQFSTMMAAGIYIFGCIGTTIVVNVPMNNRLAEVDADSEQGRDYWQHYLGVWTRWNHLRSISTISATCLLAVSLANL